MHRSLEVWTAATRSPARTRRYAPDRERYIPGGTFYSGKDLFCRVAARLTGVVGLPSTVTASLSLLRGPIVAGTLGPILNLHCGPRPFCQAAARLRARPTCPIACPGLTALLTRPDSRQDNSAPSRHGPIVQLQPNCGLIVAKNCRLLRSDCCSGETRLTLAARLPPTGALEPIKPRPDCRRRTARGLITVFRHGLIVVGRIAGARASRPDCIAPVSPAAGLFAATADVKPCGPAVCS